MNARLHVRAEYGGITIHPGYDLDTLADLAIAWRAASRTDVPLQPFLEAEQALREYLRLDLDVSAAHALMQELDDAGVRTAPF